MMESMIAESMARLGTETAFEVLVRARALEARAEHRPPGDRRARLRHARPRRRGRDQGARRRAHALRPAAGLLELREAIAEDSRRRAASGRRRTRSSSRPGAKPIMFYVFLAFVEEGRRGRLPEPGLPDLRVDDRLRRRAARAARASARRTASARRRRARAAGHRPDELLILNTPGEPDGRRAKPDASPRIAEIAGTTTCSVLSDEIYSRILYDGPARVDRGLPGMRERTIVLDGFSKTYAMTGWRLGYGVMPKAWPRASPS